MESINNAVKKIEIILAYKNQAYSVFLERESSFLELKEAIQSALALPKTNILEVYSGNYYLSELFNGIPLEKVNEFFMSNKYNVLYNNEKDPFTDFMQNKNLEDFFKHHKDTVQKYLEINDVNTNLKDSYNDLKKQASILQNACEYIIKEEDFFNKAGILSTHDKLSLKLERDSKKINEMEAYLDRGFVKILELKNSEKEAVDFIKENKNLVSIIHQNSRVVEKKKKLISNLKNHRIIIIKF